MSNEYTGQLDRNPVMDDAGTHTATPRLRFMNGRLQQLFWPCDGVSTPEWRDAPDATPVEPDTPQ
jgi:hypothetical protein